MMVQTLKQFLFSFFKSKNFGLSYLLPLLLLYLLLPSSNIGDYVNSTITSKTIFFNYALLIITILYVLRTSINSKNSFLIKISRIDIVISILFIYLVANRYFLQTDYGFSIRFIELLGLSALYLILRKITFKNHLWLMLAIVLSGIVQAVYGNLQLLGYYTSNHSGFNMTGSFFNPGPYAGFLTAVWPIAFGMYLYREHIMKDLQMKTNLKVLDRFIAMVVNYIPLVCIISISIVIPATRSRAAWIAIALSSVVLLEYRYVVFKTFIENMTRIKRSFLIMVSVVIIGSLLLGIYNFKKESSDGRLFIWKVTIDIIKENPVFGVGFDRFKAHYMNSQAGYFEQHGETSEAMVADNTYYAFNEGLQFIAENGLIGVLFLGVLLYVITRTPIKKEKKYLFVLLNAGLLAIGCFAFFSYPMQILPIKIVLLMLICFLAKMDVGKYALFKDFKPKRKVSLLFKILIFTATLLMVFKAFEHTNLLSQSLKKWKYALDSYQYGDYEGAVEEFKNVYPIFKNDGDFLMNYGKALSMDKQDAMAVNVLEKAKLYLNTTIIETALGDSYKNLKQYDEAERAYRSASNMIPSRFYPLYLLAKLYEENGEKEKALLTANIILKKEIKVPSTAINEIRLEMKKIISQNDEKKIQN